MKDDIRDFKIRTKTMGSATIDVLLMHCLEWTSHVSVHAKLKVPTINKTDTRGVFHKVPKLNLSLSWT